MLAIFDSLVFRIRYLKMLLWCFKDPFGFGEAPERKRGEGQEGQESR